MNAIDLLKLDHRVVDALFQKAMSMDPSKRGPVYKKISNELASHAHIEETILYPRLIKEGDKELKKIVLEGIEEHAQIHMFHDQLDTMKPSEEKFEPKLTVLQEDIRHHVKEEENEMFDMVQEQFSAESLDRLGEELEAERKRFQKQKGIPARTPADKALGQGMLSRLVDAVTGMFVPEPSGGKSGSKARSSAKPSSGRTASKSSSSASKGNGSSAKSKGSAKSTAGRSSSSARSSSPTASKSTNGRSVSAKGKGASTRSSKTSSAAGRSKSKPAASARSAGR